MELLTIEQLREQNYQLQGLEIKQYLPLPAKQLLIKNILQLCTSEENDLIKVDYILKEFSYEFMLINWYTNIDCQVEEIVQFYDELKENKVVDEILEQIPELEKQLLDYVLRKEIEQIQQIDNSISSILSKSLNKLILKLPDDKNWSKLLKEIPKQINKIEPEKFSCLSQAINWNNGIKKEG